MAKGMRTSRSARLVDLGTLAGSEVAKQAATRTANLVRSDRRAQMALEARQAEFAERLVIVLGSMRGAAMKFGQMLSMIDGGLLPEGQRAQFQGKLAALQDQAPDVPWETMRAHIECELGHEFSTVFADFPEHAIAAASIGQVYRATLHDGRVVAVKVQYPEIETAVRSDLKNLAMFLGAYKLVHTGLDVKALTVELEERILAELDYELEAANTRAIAREYRDHPFIRVPDVVSSACSTRVLVTEWLDGKPLSAAYDAPLPERNRIAEILFRFYSGTPHRMSLYSGDPHPGNSLLLDDGSVGFLDFGLVKQLDAETAETEIAYLRALIEGDPARLVEALSEHGWIADRDAFTPQAIYDAFLEIAGWYVRDEEITLTPEIANAIIAGAINPHSQTYQIVRRQNLPPEHAFRGRAEVHLAAVLGQLRPQLNLHRVAREWLYDDPPATALGRLQRDWELTRGTPLA